MSLNLSSEARSEDVRAVPIMVYLWWFLSLLITLPTKQIVNMTVDLLKREKGK
jgi:hypothetical protein